MLKRYLFVVAETVFVKKAEPDPCAQRTADPTGSGSAALSDRTFQFCYPSTIRYASVVRFSLKHSVSDPDPVGYTIFWIRNRLFNYELSFKKKGLEHLRKP